MILEDLYSKYIKLKRSIEPQSAMPQRRTMAFIVDVIIIFIPRVALFNFYNFIISRKIIKTSSSGAIVFVSFSFWVLFFLVGFLYRYSNVKYRKQTIGMRFFKLKIETEYPYLFDKKRILIREAVFLFQVFLFFLFFVFGYSKNLIISTIIACILFAWYKFSAFDRKRRFFHDYISKTNIVNEV